MYVEAARAGVSVNPEVPGFQLPDFAYVALSREAQPENSFSNRPSTLAHTPKACNLQPQTASNFHAKHRNAYKEP